MIAITETWLIEETKECYTIHNYSAERNVRPVKSGKGAAVFVKNGRDYHAMNDYLETLFIETDKEVVSNQNNMFVGIMCRPPGIDIFTINDEMGTIGVRK